MAEVDGAAAAAEEEEVEVPVIQSPPLNVVRNFVLTLAFVFSFYCCRVMLWHWQSPLWR